MMIQGLFPKRPRQILPVASSASRYDRVVFSEDELRVAINEVAELSPPVAGIRGINRVITIGGNITITQPVVIPERAVGLTIRGAFGLGQVLAKNDLDVIFDVRSIVTTFVDLSLRAAQAVPGVTTQIPRVAFRVAGGLTLRMQNVDALFIESYLEAAPSPSAALENVYINGGSHQTAFDPASNLSLDIKANAINIRGFYTSQVGDCEFEPDSRLEIVGCSLGDVAVNAPGGSTMAIAASTIAGDLDVSGDVSGSVSGGVCGGVISASTSKLSIMGVALRGGVIDTSGSSGGNTIIGNTDVLSIVPGVGDIYVGLNT